MLTLKQEGGARPLAEPARLVQWGFPNAAIDRLDPSISCYDIFHRANGKRDYWRRK